MKRPLVILVLVLLAILFNAHNVIAIPQLAVTPGSVGAEYVPGQTYDFQVFVDGNPNDSLLIEAGGELGNYVEILTKAVTLGADGRAQVLFRFTVPQIDAPGVHTAFVAIKQNPPLRGFGEPSMIVATAAVHVPITVYVPCPDRCIGLTFGAKDANLDQPVLFAAQVSNIGSKEIGNITGYVEIDKDGNTVATVPLTSSQALAPGANVMLQSEWDTTGANVGVYTANAVVLYDEFSKTATADFRVGDFLIKILGLSPQKFYQMETAKLFVSIQSVWNEPINSIYGVFHLKNLNGTEIAQVTTPTMASIDPGATTSLNALLDIGNQSIGNYTMGVEVFYESKTSSADFPVEIVEKSLNPEASFKFDTTTAIIFALVVLIAILLYLHERKRAKSKLF